MRPKKVETEDTKNENLKSINQSIDRSANQSMDQSTDKSNNQSINRRIPPTVWGSSEKRTSEKSIQSINLLRPQKATQDETQNIE